MVIDVFSVHNTKLTVKAANGLSKLATLLNCNIHVLKRAPAGHNGGFRLGWIPGDYPVLYVVLAAQAVIHGPEFYLLKNVKRRELGILLQEF